MVNAFLVGTPGIGVRGTATAAVGRYSQPPAAGNLLVAVVKGSSTTSQSASFAQTSGTTGWTQAIASGNSATFFARVEVWTKVAAGADAAPSFDTFTAGTRANHVTIYEIFNPNASPIDVSGTKGSGASSISIASAALSTATSAAVSGTGELGFYAFAGMIPGGAATNTYTKAASLSYNIYNDASTSSQIHVADDYGFAPASGSVLTAAPTITTYTGYAASVVFVIGHGAATYPLGQISAVGRATSGGGSGSVTFGISTPGIIQSGDLVVLTTSILSATLTVSSITDAASLNITTGWTRVAGPFVDNESGSIRSQEIWIGKSTGTGITTFTFTWSGSVTGLDIEYVYQEFTSGYTWSTWSRDGTQQAGQNNTASTTHNWASLTAAAAGDLFFGMCRAIAGGPYRTTVADSVCAQNTPKLNAFHYRTNSPSGAVAQSVIDAVSVASHTLGVLLDYVNVWPIGGAADTDTMDGTGAIEIIRIYNVTGLSVTPSAGTGAVVLSMAVAGSSATPSTASGTLGMTDIVSGSSATASAANGTITRTTIVSGLSITVSSATGALGRVQPIAGSSSTASAASGTIVMTAIVAGSSATASSATGAIGRFTPPAGLSTTVSATSGTITLTAIVAGSSYTASFATGSLSRVTPLSGLSSTASSGSGAITISTGAIVYSVSGSSITQSHADGSISRLGAIAGISSTPSHADGAVTVVTGAIIFAIAGSSSTSSSANGSLSTMVALSGLAATVSSASGTATLIMTVSGLSVTVSAASGSVSRAGSLTGSSATESYADGFIAVVLGVAGISVTVSEADGWILAPFVPGALPPKITALVFVNPAPRVTIGVNLTGADVTISVVAAVVSAGKAKSNVSINDLRAEVT